MVALLRAKLSVERAGFKLDAAIINMLVEYVVASGITDANDVLLTDVLMYADEAWSESHDGKALPGIQVNKIKTGDPIEVAKVLRDLAIMKMEKNLSFGEKKMYDQARGLLVQEISCAKDVEESVIDGELDALFKPIEPKNS